MAVRAGAGHHMWTGRGTGRRLLSDDHGCLATVYYPPLTELCREYLASLSDCDC